MFKNKTFFLVHGNGVDKMPLRCYNFSMKNLPLGIQTFSKMINGDYLTLEV